MSRYDQFEKELEQLINRHSMEQDSNTPDFILAKYLMECLHVFNRVVEIRTCWYSDKPVKEL